MLYRAVHCSALHHTDNHEDDRYRRWSTKRWSTLCPVPLHSLRYLIHTSTFHPASFILLSHYNAIQLIRSSISSFMYYFFSSLIRCRSNSLFTFHFSHFLAQYLSERSCLHWYGKSNHFQATPLNKVFFFLFFFLLLLLLLLSSIFFILLEGFILPTSMIYLFFLSFWLNFFLSVYTFSPLKMIISFLICISRTKIASSFPLHFTWFLSLLLFLLLLHFL